MESEVKKLQEAKDVFENLLTKKYNLKSVLFSEEKLSLKLLKKFKKSSYIDDKKLLKLINIAENSIEEFNKADDEIPIRLDYVERREIDRSTYMETVNYNNNLNVDDISDAETTNYTDKYPPK